MIGMVELATHDDASVWTIVDEFVVEMSIGLAVGVIGALALGCAHAPRAAARLGRSTRSR